jgi:hypothetical protein
MFLQVSVRFVSVTAQEARRLHNLIRLGKSTHSEATTANRSNLFLLSHSGREKERNRSPKMVSNVLKLNGLTLLQILPRGMRNNGR